MYVCMYVCVYVHLTRLFLCLVRKQNGLMKKQRMEIMSLRSSEIKSIPLVAKFPLNTLLTIWHVPKSPLMEQVALGVPAMECTPSTKKVQVCTC